MNQYRHYHLKLNYKRDKKLIEILDKSPNKNELVRLLYFYYDTFKDISKLPWLELEIEGGENG